MGERILITTMLALTTLFSTPPEPATADEPKPRPDTPLNAAMRAMVIEGVLKHLKDAYVFPEVADKMEAAILGRVRKNEYDSATSGSAFAEALTQHVREVSRDKHLGVMHSVEPFPVREERGPGPEELERMRRWSESRNHGFLKVERLAGNVGYLELEGFTSPEIAGDTAAAAMAFLANTSALILDLRKNHGGSPDMVALLCSYFFAERVHLNDLYWRAENRTDQFWTLPHLPGKRYLDKEVYVLTSKETFSGAEEFTYNLKNLKRATIVGETTGGGAHPVDWRRISDHFAILVPTGRALNPITKTNWEGTGVTPDVAVPAEEALKKAHLMALEHLLPKTTDEEAAEELKRAIETTRKELEATREPRKSAS